MAHMLFIVQKYRRNITSEGAQIYVSRHTFKVSEQVSCPKRLQRQISYCYSCNDLKLFGPEKCMQSPTNFAGDFLPEENLKQRAL